MSIKLVAIDLDDTLLDSGLKIADNCLQAISQVQQKGILVTLATVAVCTLLLYLCPAPKGRCSFDYLSRCPGEKFPFRRNSLFSSPTFATSNGDN